MLSYLRGSSNAAKLEAVFPDEIEFHLPAKDDSTLPARIQFPLETADVRRRQAVTDGGFFKLREKMILPLTYFMKSRKMRFAT